jgi:hypothetical protein
MVMETAFVDVYYDPRLSVPGLEDWAPSAGIPARFVERLQAEGLAVNLRPVTPATRADLLRVHDAGYVDGVFAGTTLNGLQNNDRRVAESCLWTVGSLVTAALAARPGDRPACSPTSGFHHAGHRWGGAATAPSTACWWQPADSSTRTLAPRSASWTATRTSVTAPRTS